MKSRSLCTSILTACCLNLVSACAMQPSVQRTELPANLLQPCPRLQETPQEKPLALGDFLASDISVIDAYGECALRHKELLEAVKPPNERK